MGFDPRELWANKELAAFVERYRLEVIMGRGLSVPSTPGPLIMARARPKAIEYARGVTALCAIVGNADVTRPRAEVVVKGVEVVRSSPWIDCTAEQQ